VNVVSVFTMRLPACILVLECQLRVKRSRCVKSDFATDLNNCDPRAFESPCQLLCVCVCMLNTWTWHAGQVRMSSAIGKQVNDSIAKDKQGDKQGLGEQNPCEVCSKGCTCAVVAQTARANHVLELSLRHLYTRATRPARLRGNRRRL